MCLKATYSRTDFNRGGLGLTSGIADVGGLVDCLYGINDGKATFNILDKWDELSRQKYHTMVDPVSSVNLCRIQNSPETAMDTDPFLKKMKEASQDEAFFRTQLEVSHNRLRFCLEAPNPILLERLEDE